MTAELSLILLLFLCVITLTLLLYNRIKGERKQRDFIQDLSVNELSDFMKKNSIDGSISVVARLFSDILKKTFKCEYIIFVRKKRNILELNYYHGINAFNRNDFKIDYSRELKILLKDDFFPRDVSVLDNFLSDKFKSKINAFGMDKFFPVFWRDNLYGFYVIKSNQSTNSESFRIVIAQMVLSLAAAYHIKWHESKYIKIQEQLNSVHVTTKVTEGDKQVERVLEFMKCKRTDALLPQVVKSLQESSRMEDLILMYENGTKESVEIISIGKKAIQKLNPKSNELKRIADSLHLQSIISVEDIRSKLTDKISWIEILKENNINKITSFPLSQNRRGVLAWKQNGESEEISQTVHLYKRYISDIFENIEEVEQLEELSYTDNLTTLSNRRYFYKRLDEELNRAKRYNRKLALIIFDLDELKNINDTYGHQAGDEIISQIGGLLKKFIRAIDVVARYGGDEFCIIMPETDQGTCLKFVQRLHTKIQNKFIYLESAKKSVSCTISMGIAIYPDHALGSEKLIYAADMALLKAKESGRNQAVICSVQAESE